MGAFGGECTKTEVGGRHLTRPLEWVILAGSTGRTGEDWMSEESEFMNCLFNVLGGV